MSRISGISQDKADGYIKQVYENQIKNYGAVLENHKLYARRPSIFKAVRGMWDSISISGLIEQQLQALINIRVANINGCPF